MKYLVFSELLFFKLKSRPIFYIKACWRVTKIYILFKLIFFNKNNKPYLYRQKYGELVENTKIFEITTFKELCNLTQKLRENGRPQDYISRRLQLKGGSDCLTKTQDYAKL